MEHVERQEQRENEIRADADRLEEEGDRLEERGDELEQKIGGVREEFERKKASDDVPGAQPEDELGIGSGPPPEADITPGDDDD